MERRFSSFVFCLLILSFLTAGISPACHFISGLSGGGDFLEICGSDGALKRISLADAGFAPADKPPSHPHQKLQDQCMFCFAFSLAKYSGAAAVILPAGPGADYAYNGRGTFAPKRFDVRAFEPRGPPALSLS